MKKYLLVALCCFFACATFSQSGPTAPQTYKAKVMNSSLLYEAIRDVDIPVYLSYPMDVNIKYCWYDTDLVWGEQVRTSETPCRKEEGTYTNGRLSMYKKGDYFYQILWSPDGAIKSINKYNSSGNLIQEYTFSSIKGHREGYHRAHWEDYKSISCEGKGLASPSSIHISRALVFYEYKRNDCVFLEAYCIEDGWLCVKCVEKDLERVRGQLAKKWVDRSETYQRKKINSDGSFDGKSCFDINNKVKCEYFVF